MLSYPRPGTLGAAGFLIVSLGVLAGCAPALLGAGATAGIVAAQDREVADAATDTQIRFQINEKWFQHDLDMMQRLNLSVNEGTVLVTGSLPDPERRVEAVRLIWEVDGVREVLNEIQVADSGGVGPTARDGMIRARLRSALALDTNVRAINYSVDVNDAVVYVMGSAADTNERDRVVNHARNIPYVQRVVDYITVRES